MIIISVVSENCKIKYNLTIKKRSGYKNVFKNGLEIVDHIQIIDPIDLTIKPKSNIACPVSYIFKRWNWKWAELSSRLKHLRSFNALLTFNIHKLSYSPALKFFEQN